MQIEDLNLSNLKYFLDAVELGSLTLSANRNHISRPAVSQAIIRLGQWYGKALLTHEKRSFELTPEGRGFYRLAKHAFEQLQTGFANSSEEIEPVKIGLSVSLLDVAIPLIAKPLKTAGISSVKVGTTAQLMKFLGEGSINLCFTIDDGSEHGFQSFSFRSGHFQIRSRSGKLEKLLITTENRPEVLGFRKAALKRKMDFASHVQVESWSVCDRLAHADFGCCLVPDFIPMQGLRAVKIPGWTSRYSAVVLIRKRHELTKLENDILEHVIQSSEN